MCIAAHTYANRAGPLLTMAIVYNHCSTFLKSTFSWSGRFSSDCVSLLQLFASLPHLLCLVDFATLGKKQATQD